MSLIYIFFYFFFKGRDSGFLIENQFFHVQKKFFCFVFLFDSQVIYCSNMLATESVYLNNILFKGDSYITMYLGEETSVDVETYKIDVGGDRLFI